MFLTRPLSGFEPLTLSPYVEAKEGVATMAKRFGDEVDAESRVRLGRGLLAAEAAILEVSRAVGRFGSRGMLPRLTARDR